jgi:NAD(P)H dehydrogenase (quinone)
MTIAVTGATGHLGRLAVQALLARGVPPADIVATGRNIAKIAELADLGVQVRASDYTEADSLRAVFEGTDRVLFVSGSEAGQRLAQHRNVVAALSDTKPDLVAYTSIAHADTAHLRLASEHLATERLLAEAGLPYTFLRNSWYVENYTQQLPVYLEHGGVLGSAGDGRVSAALRSEYAEAAAAVLTSDGHAGEVYELGGDESFTLSELAATIGTAAGRDVAYIDLPADAYTEALVQAGLDRSYAETLADADLGLARGELLVDTGHLNRLIGRPTTSRLGVVTEALAGLAVTG